MNGWRRWRPSTKPWQRRYGGWSARAYPGTPELNALLTERGTAAVDSGCRLIDLLRRPQLTYADLPVIDTNRPDLPAEVREQVEITVKYEAGIQRQQRQVVSLRLERRKLPLDMDYDHIQGSRLARGELGALRPLNVGWRYPACRRRMWRRCWIGCRHEQRWT